MYQRVYDEQHMTDNEVSEHYPDSYALVRWDSTESVTGTILYIGDDRDELFSLSMTLSDPVCGVIEGLNHQRSLGGVVVGG